MLIDEIFLDNLSARAKESPRLRINFDMRMSPQDSSQRMLNAVELGTVVPVHRHRESTETMIVVRGKGILSYYDDAGNILSSMELSGNGGNRMVNIPLGQWHSFEVLESGTVLFECKDGTYVPLTDIDIQK